MSRISYINEKIVSVETAKLIINGWKMKDQTIVFTNGCFDIIHQGHVEYLAKAAQLGTKLVVAINTDQSVKAQQKSPERPINNEEARSFVIAAFGFVDLVVLFNNDTPIEEIKNLVPDVLVKGADYDANETDVHSKKYIVGSDFVRQNGGMVETIDLVEGYSTTNIINKIKN